MFVKGAGCRLHLYVHHIVQKVSLSIVVYRDYIPGTCRRKAREASVTSSQPERTPPRIAENPVWRGNDAEETRNTFWGEKNVREVLKIIEDAYEYFIFWKKNLFMLPIGAAAKLNKSEITGFMNSWTNNFPLKHFHFIVINVMLNLLLLKSSRVSKSEDHLRALYRRIDIWKIGKIDELLIDGQTI